MVIQRTRGFTLPELLIVITVLAVLLAAGMPSFGEFMRNQRVKTASFDLYSTLVHARSEAITRNATVTIAPVSSAWTNGWTMTDSGGTVIRSMGAVPNVTITRVDAGPANVEFRGSGRLNVAVMPTFQLTASGSTVTTRCITIDLSGRPTTKATACS
jgi:type IV fimbrial biogenesis protein FimT